MMKDIHNCTRMLKEPGYLCNLMGLYESNYARLHQLLPNGIKTAANAQWILKSPRHLDLSLRVERVSRCVLSLEMNYIFYRPDDDCYLAPRLEIRVYNDARLAEAVNCHKYRDSPPKSSLYNLPSMLAYRWRINVLLNKWLDQALQQHYRSEHQKP